jgi:predicted RNA-binding Zn ribbon-like protein
MASDIALVLTELIRSGDRERPRTSAAEDCCAVFADLTKNTSKRFCDLRHCANRTSAAAYRSRRGVRASE